LQRTIGRLVAAFAMALAIVLPSAIGSVDAAGGGDRTLYLHHTHTGETARITFKRNGRYDRKGLQQLNWFLRDWRNNKTIEMDPHLFDLVWEVYQAVGATQPINIVSSYRAPETNAMLRRTSSGVAENSQHMKGKAMDFFIPGIDLSTLRATAMRFQVGGVGYYPTSGSPFVHLDTGSVRAWPRMTTAQLKRIFPDGKTLHLPTNGKPLSSAGRQYAQAQWQKCHQVPCGIGDNIQVASASGGNGGIFGALFNKPAPGQRAVTTVPVTPPIPAQRPDDLGAARVEMASLDAPTPAPLPFGTEGSAPLTEAELTAPAEPAPIPMQKPERLLVATAEAPPQPATPDTAVMALAALTPPAPALATTGARDNAVVAAYAPEDKPALRTASLGGDPALGTVAGLVDMTWNAVGKAAVAPPVAKAVAAFAASQPLPNVATRDVELVAPDLDHVAEIFTQPAHLTSSTYAALFEPDEAALDPAAELGPYVTRIAFRPSGPVGLESSRFVTGQPLLLAAR
jgi:uncharacterized protein YcbK (DUF882 family)